jgi:hypothetical protein
VLQDGFEIAGHRATVTELPGMGIDIDVHDLNFDLALRPLNRVVSSHGDP